MGLTTEQGTGLKWFSEKGFAINTEWGKTGDKGDKIAPKNIQRSYFGKKNWIKEGLNSTIESLAKTRLGVSYT